jgi:hypothetical protein
MQNDPMDPIAEGSLVPNRGRVKSEDVFSYRNPSATPACVVNEKISDSVVLSSLKQDSSAALHSTIRLGPRFAAITENPMQISVPNWRLRSAMQALLSRRGDPHESIAAADIRLRTMMCSARSSGRALARI